MPPLFGESIHRMTTQYLIAIHPAIALHLTTGKIIMELLVRVRPPSSQGVEHQSARCALSSPTSHTWSDTSCPTDYSELVVK